MEKGDLVKVKDFSWSVRIRRGKLVDEWCRHEKEETWEILAVGCKLPSNPCATKCYDANNTIICSQKSGEVVFTQEKYLKRVGRKCLYCGQIMKEEKSEK